MRNIALMLPNWIGDVVMATPAIRAVRRQFPHAHLLGIMRPYVARTLDGTPWLDETLLYDPRGEAAAGRGPLVRELRRRALDCTLLFPNSLSTALMSWLGGSRRRVGYARNGRSWLLTDQLHPLREGGAIMPTSAIDYYLKLAEQIGCQQLSRQMKLAVTGAEAASADRVWQKLGLYEAGNVVAINTGGAYGTAKRWPDHHTARLAKEIVARFDAKVVLICGPAERASVRQIVREVASPDVVNLAEEPLSIGLTKACLSRSDLLITTDSGPRHLAAALGTPTISLFGPTDPRWADNYHLHDRQLSIPLDCGPCAKRSCPLGHHACMEQLTPERVLLAIGSMLPAASERGSRVAC